MPPSYSTQILETPDTTGTLGRKDILRGLVVALACVLLIAFFTKPQPPLHDAFEYVAMARDGIFGNAHLAAPFAYRPAVPMIVGVLARVADLPIETGFTLLTWLGAISLLLLVYLFVYRRTSSIEAGTSVTALLAFSYYQVRFPLTMSAMVDAEAYPLIVAATWFLIQRRFALCLLISCVGLFFKEFLLIPLAAMFFVLLLDYRRTHRPAPLGWAIATVSAAAACFVLPRALIPIGTVYGSSLRIGLPSPDSLGYIHKLRFLLSDPTEGLRYINLAFALAGYWFPTMLLVTGDRLRTMWEWLSGNRIIVITNIIGVSFLALFGGTNIMIFVTYGVAAQMIILCGLYRSRITILESCYAILAVIVFNRLWLPVPLYAGHFSEAINMFGGWGSLVTESTLERTIELCGYTVIGIILRRMFWRGQSGDPGSLSPADREQGRVDSHPKP